MSAVTRTLPPASDLASWVAMSPQTSVDWTEEIAAKFGYAEVDRTLEVLGGCPTCAARPGEA